MSTALKDIPGPVARRRDRARIRPFPRRRARCTASPTTASTSGPPPAPCWSPSTRRAARPSRTLDRACDAGTAFDGKHLYQIAEARIDKIDPATGDVVASIPAPGNGGDSGLAWAEGSLWVGQYRDRKIHQIDPATGAVLPHHRVEPLRHRRHLGRRRAVARHLGRRRERDPPHRPGERRRARAPGDAARHRRQRPRVRRRGPVLLPAAAPAARCAPCAARRSRRNADPLRQPRSRSTGMNTTSAASHPANLPSFRAERWLAERKALLAREKELTRLRDEIARERRALPWERVDKDYVFDTLEGQRSLADLFDGRRQLLVQHFMLGPGWEQGCPSCSFMADHIDGMQRAPGAPRHLLRGRLARAAGRDRALPAAHGLEVQLGLVGRQRLQPRLPRQLHAGGAGHGEVYYNYAPAAVPEREAPGISVFWRDDAGEVFHTYSTYGRGVEVMMGTYDLLDLTPQGRDERDVPYKMEWVRHHDRYAPQPPRPRRLPPARAAQQRPEGCRRPTAAELRDGDRGPGWRSPASAPFMARARPPAGALAACVRPAGALRARRRGARCCRWPRSGLGIAVDRRRGWRWGARCIAR